MGNILSNGQLKTYNFENVLSTINNNNIIINTLPTNNQSCLIVGTISIENEEQILNDCLKSNKNEKIVVYGKNSYDEKVIIKYKQLYGLGFTDVNIYMGGMFEWLLLQEIYGKDNFPTTTEEIDILKYK